MATKHKYRCNWKQQSYGAELELTDWPRRREALPAGMVVDEAELHNVNSNGVAVDGPGVLYDRGGELLTAPSVRVEGPAEQYATIQSRWPEASVNYRMGLNVHVRVPGLREDLIRLKRLQDFCSRVLPDLLPAIDPIPEPPRGAGKGARENYRKRKRDHHTVVPAWRAELQARARGPREFFEAEVIHPPAGRLCWAIVPRNCVNLRQLLQTDTVEFRHFFMPATPEELLNATEWCQLFLRAALGGGTVTAKELLAEFGLERRAWPRPLPYDPWLDEGWHATTRHHHPPEEVPGRIREWLARTERSPLFQE